jgi:hypothetical protein
MNLILIPKALALPLLKLLTMKKLNIKIQLIVLLAIALSKLNAQTATATLTVLSQPCNGNGIVKVSSTGLIPPITFFWAYNNAYVQNTKTTTADTVFNFLGGARISCSMRDSLGNYAWADSIFLLPFTFTTTVNEPICPSITGTCSVSMTGGAPPFTAVWKDYYSGAVVATGLNTNLTTGTYFVYVTDASGCSIAPDTISILSQSPINLTTSTTTANCTNGTASVTSATGGVAPYTYSWSNGQTTATANNLSTGYYSVVVTDFQGCTQNAGWLFVPQGIAIHAHVVPTTATCLQNDGSAISFGSGGVPPYNYIYSSGQTTQNATGFVAGYYSLQVADVNGCIGDTSFQINSSTPITVTYVATTSSCTLPTGSASLTISGGLAPYTINWTTSPVQTGSVITNVAEGQYYFNVTDANGCVRSGNAYVPPVSNLSTSPYSTPAICPNNNGVAFSNAYSSSVPLTYIWNTGATTPNAASLNPGVYSYTVTDALGCKKHKTIEVFQSSPINIGLTPTQATCIFTSDGSITAHATGGTPPYTYHWSSGQTTQNVSGLAGGFWYGVDVTDFNGCTKEDWVYLDYNHAATNCYCTVTGTVYADVNGNCVKDAGETPVQHMMIKNNNTNTTYSVSSYMFTDANGDYSFILPTGNYNIQEVIQYLYPPAACQSNSNPMTLIASPGCNVTVNFANAINPIHDVHVINSHLTMPVPGNNYVQELIIQNDGTVSENNVQFGYGHDGQLSYVSSTGVSLTQPNSVAAPNWYDNTSTVPVLNPGQAVATLVTLAVPTNIPLGTVVNFWDSTAYASPMSNWLNDYTPWNNVKAFDTVVVGSFDPNEIEVSPRGVGPMGFVHSSDTVFDYVIHFQNTGTWNASKIVVKDVLDANFNWESLKPGYSNHSYTASMTNNGELSFTFKNINLPPANNYPIGSIGTICYSIHAKKNLPQGTQFKNSASIYFDYNAPVLTNTTVNTINDAVGIKEIVKSKDGMMSIFPNPANENCTVKVVSEEDAVAKISIYSMNGDLVSSNDTRFEKGENTFSFPVSSLMPGLYLVRTVYNNKMHVCKLSVIR